MVDLFMMELDTCLPVEVPCSLGLEKLSLEESDMVSVREDGDERPKGEKTKNKQDKCY